MIRRKPLESYNYEQPVMKIVAIRDNLYVFEEKGLALEIWAQDEWELYDTFRRRLWRNIKYWLSWIFRYHQPARNPFGTKHVGRMKKTPGHMLFAYHKETGTIEHVPAANGTVLIKEGWIYRQALNKKNLIKKLRREGIIHE